MTVAAALRSARERLAAAGVGNPDLDAALLLAEVLGVRRERLALERGRLLDERQVQRFEALVAERARRRPIAQILGRAEFWSLEFRVTADVLTPRPETEMLVAEAVTAVRGIASPVLVDVGTGTGCIAIAIAKEVPSAVVHAIDVSRAALEVARENAIRLGVGERVRFHEGEYLAPLVGVVARRSVDVVVSNPPYVRRDEEFDPELLHEPAVALFVDDVPGVYRTIAEDAVAFVRSGGTLLLELPGDTSAPVVDAVRATDGLVVDAVLTDPDGHPRVLRATAS